MPIEKLVKQGLGLIV